MHKKISIVLIQTVQALIWVHILSFVTYLAYPTPTNIYENAPTWLKGLALYHSDIQNIFYIYSFAIFVLTIFLFIKKRNSYIKWFFLFLGILAFYYGYSATRGYTWYFYSNIDRTGKLIIASVFLILFSFLLHAWQKNRYNKSFEKILQNKFIHNNNHNPRGITRDRKKIVPLLRELLKLRLENAVLMNMEK